MILEVDVGNSALKWRVINAQGDVLARGRSLLTASNMLYELSVEFPSVRVARVSCVAKADVRERLGACIFDLWGVRSRFAETKKWFSGLSIAYDAPARLGVDRWLAMLAAFHEVGGPVCVFDCGSAVTVDSVEAGGVHKGGYIVPGLRMQRDALLNSTGQIRIEKAVDDSSLGWGASTEEAVGYGVTRMVSGFIDELVDELLANKMPPSLFLTGGDAPLLFPLLKHSSLFEVRPELVMDGLVVALP